MVAGSNCMGPSAPASFAPERTPGRSEVALSDSTVPIAASTDHGYPGRVTAGWPCEHHHQEHEPDRGDPDDVEPAHRQPPGFALCRPH